MPKVETITVKIKVDTELPICPECAAVVVDRDKHLDWHSRTTTESETFPMNGELT